MAKSARQLITRAMREIGVLGARQPPNTDDLAEGLVVLNSWVTDLDTQRATIFTVKREVFSLTAGTASYTIGPGGTWNTIRPLRIESVGLVLDRTASIPTEIPLGLPASDAEWARVVAKTITTSYPSLAYYDRGFESTGLGRIYLHPIPNQNNSDLVLYLPRPMQEFADLSTLYAFPPGYERAIETNLALELAPMFEKEPSMLLVQKAERAMTTLKRANRTPRILRLDPALTDRAAPYNIWTDR